MKTELGARKGYGLAPLIAALALSGCPPAPGSTCTSDSQCDQRSICFQQVCRLGCNSNQDCTGGEVCAQGVCLPPELVQARDAGPTADGATGDASSDASDGATGDASSQDRGALDDAAVTDRPADAAAGDATAVDAMVCLSAFQDDDHDCQVRSTEVVVCHAGGLPAGWCQAPLLQVQGPRSASVAESRPTSGGSRSWSGEDNTGASDDRDATFEFDNDEVSPRLVLTGFGFNLPAQAIVVGVVAVVERSSEGNGGTVVDSEVRLVRGGSAVGLNRALAEAWPTADTSASYGHLSDTWGETLSGADVSDPAFGIAIAASFAGSGHNTKAQVDLVQLTIHFHDDCDDHAATRSLSRYLDGDGDGFGVDPLLCVGQEAGHSLVAGDCNDLDSMTWRHRYRDVDLDGYGVGSALCVGDGPGFSDRSDDCDDADNRVHPAQLSYYSTGRSDGTFDFNCDGADTPQNGCVTAASTTACSTAAVSGVAEGWVGTIPGCGASATYRGCIGSSSATCPVADFDGLHSCTARTCDDVYSRVADVTAAQACR